jgi:subtilisin
LGPEELRFGVAQSAIAHVGRVFRGSSIPGVCGAPDGDILNAIQWAMDKGCAVVSMSFGRRPICTRRYSPAYETIARNALAQGTLLVAAAGNDSERFPEDPKIYPVHEPANCPSIMAVGAIDPCGRLTFNSNGGGSSSAGKVDICGPGANILSAYIAPSDFDRAHGTSVATPFVAAIAALYAEACGVRGKHLWNLLQQKAAPLEHEPSKDIGAGLVRAPLDFNYGETR